MGRSRGIQDEERLVRCRRLLVMDPSYDLIRKVAIQYVVLLSERCIFNGLNTTIHLWSELIRVSVNETIKVLEPQSCGPEIKRTCGSSLPGGNIVMFADKGGIESRIHRFFGIAFRKGLDPGPAAQGQDRVVPVNGVRGFFNEDVIALAFNGEFLDFEIKAFDIGSNAQGG